MEIICITNKDPRFYPFMGPFLAKRSVEQEIGYKIYDDDDKEWFVAVEENIGVIGFCYRQERSAGKYQIGSCYVLKDYRQKGIFKQLLDRAINDVHGMITITTRNEHLRELLIKRGFTIHTKKGSYTEYRRVSNE